MLIPQGMAYALLAGLPPIAGLYAALVPLMIYPIFGTSRQLSIGPVAMDSLLVAAGVGMMAQQGSDQYWGLAMLLALMVGVIQFIMGVFKMGFLVNFLSQPLINGFTSAAAIIIALSQLKHLLGIEIEGSQRVYLVIQRIFDQIANINSITLVLGVCCIIFIILLGKLKPKWPVTLLVVCASIIVVYSMRLDQYGVQVVGEVPRGLPSLTFPTLDWTLIQKMFPIAFTIAIISYMEGIAIAKKFASKDGYIVNTNQELVAIGLSNTTAGLFGGYPIAGSFSRTAINKHAGAQTPLSSVFNALTIALTLLFLTPLFYYMPNAALASVVIVAVSKLIDIKEPKRLLTIRKRDFFILIFSFVLTLLLGARQGILWGAVASIILIIRRISYPNVAILGRVPGTNVFRNVNNDIKTIQVEGVLLCRIDASLDYANSSYLKDKLQEATATKEGRLKALIIDASSINEIDATAMASLFDLADELESQDIGFYFTSVKAPVRTTLERSKFYERLGEDHFFFRNEDALDKLSRS
jgi:SulP family sulfate permease